LEPYYILPVTRSIYSSSFLGCVSLGILHHRESLLPGWHFDYALLPLLSPRRPSILV